MSENSVGRWKADFLEAGKAALLPGAGSRSSSREEYLAAQVRELTLALGEAMLEVRAWRKGSDQRLTLPDAPE